MIRAGCLEVLSRVASRSHCGLPQGFICWLPRGPREQPHYYPKYEVWAKEFFVVGSLVFGCFFVFFNNEKGTTNVNI